MRCGGKAQVPACLRESTMNQEAAFRHLLLMLQLGECADLEIQWEEGLPGKCQGGEMGWRQSSNSLEA